MDYFNKNFLKFLGGFVGIIAVSMGIFFGFSFWQTYSEEQEMKTLLKEIEHQQKENSVKENPAIISPSEEVNIEE